MARRTSSSGQSRKRRSGSQARGLRITPLLAVILLIGLGALALERAGRLPEPLAQAVRSTEVLVAALLRDIGIEWPRPPTAPPSPSDIADAATALTLLDRVPVEAERPRGYDREAWPHWLDENGDCQDTRQEVLAAESLEPVELSLDGCQVTRGLWRDAYTGESLRDPGELDIDHFVPLAEAYRSGGRDWSADRRAAFANDLGDSRSLIAVSASANRSKADQGPEEWLPPDRPSRCGYVVTWVVVKVRWSLAMDERERIAVSNLLRDCAAN